MKKENQNWTIKACGLLLAFLAIEYIAFFLIVPNKLVMDIALIVSFAIFVAVFLLVRSHDKKMQTDEKKDRPSISMPLLLTLIVVGALLVWLEYKYINLEDVPYFARRMSRLYAMFLITMLQLDVKRRAIKSVAESNWSC